MRRLASHKGFSLIELIIVIVILGVVAVATTQFVRFAMQIYGEGNQRAEQVAQARFTLLRLEKEIRNAVPNSVAVTGSCLSFFPIKNSGSYISGATSNLLTVIDFDGNIAVGDTLLIYPTSVSSVQNNTLDIIAVDDQGSDDNLYSLSLSHVPALRSPGKRYYVPESQVEVCLETNAGRQVLMRHQGGVMGVLAVDVNQWRVQYNAGSLRRNAMVSLFLELNSPSNERLALSHEVHIANVP